MNPESSPQLGRIAMYQGTSQEQQKYGEGVFKRGDFIDVLEGRKLVTSRIVVVHCEVIYQRWDKDQARPAYTYTHAQRNLIPAEDLEWDGELPPACAKMYRCIVLVDGEPWPYLFIVKRTMMKAFDHLLALEARRTATQRGSGLYELGAEDDPELEGFKAMDRFKVIQLRILPATGAERFAEYFYNKINNFVQAETKGRVKVIQVEFREHEKNTAFYKG